MKSYEIKIVRCVLNEDAPEAVVRTAKDVVYYAKKHCFNPEMSWREEVWVLLLNRAGRITDQFLLGLGGTAAVVMDKKAVAKVAIEGLAEAVVLVHNHPSGSCLPGQADIRQTAEVKKALSLFDIPLLDHVVLGDGEFYSFAEEKVWKS